jgi:hypothetical protein
MPEIEYTRIIEEDREELEKLEKLHRFSHLFHHVKMRRLLKSRMRRSLGAADVLDYS